MAQSPSFSLLTGKPGRSTASPVGKGAVGLDQTATAAVLHQILTAEMTLLEESMRALETTKADLARARMEVESKTAENAKLAAECDGLREKVAAASVAMSRATEMEQKMQQCEAQCNQAMQDCAAAQARCAEMEARVQAERDNAATLNARLQEALQITAFTPPEPPTYVMNIVGRDVNNRAQKIELKPKKG